MTMNDDLSGHDFPMDIGDIGMCFRTSSTLLSMGKLLREGWRFELSHDAPYAFTPTGHRVPHTTREGKDSEPLPTVPITAVKSSPEAYTGHYFHRLFNHCNSEKLPKTLESTTGFKAPDKHLPDCFCTACASANAR